MPGAVLQAVVLVLVVLLVVVVAVLLAEVITAEVIIEVVIITTVVVPMSILADTSGFPSTRIRMAITHSATIRMVTPILTPIHIRRIPIHILTIPTPMISPRYTVNKNSPIPGITAGILKGITRTSRVVRADGRR